MRLASCEECVTEKRVQNWWHLTQTDGILILELELQRRRHSLEKALAKSRSQLGLNPQILTQTRHQRQKQNKINSDEKSIEGRRETKPTIGTFFPPPGHLEGTARGDGCAPDSLKRVLEEREREKIQIFPPSPLFFLS